MPTSIPHTYRKPSGIYYLRAVLPKEFRDIFPSVGREIRLSLNTRHHAEAKMRLYQFINNVNFTIDLFLTCYYNTQLCRFSIFKKDILNRYNINLNNITIFSGDEPCDWHAVTKRDFYMIMEQIRYVHPDGSVISFLSKDWENNINGLKALREHEMGLYPVPSSLSCKKDSFKFNDVSSNNVIDTDFIECFRDSYTPDLPDTVWDHIISKQQKALNIEEKQSVNEIGVTDVQSDESIPSEVCSVEQIPLKGKKSIILSDEKVETISDAPVSDAHLDENTDADVEYVDQPETAELTTPLATPNSNNPEDMDGNTSIGQFVEYYFKQMDKEERYKAGTSTYNKYVGYMKGVVELLGYDTPLRELRPLKVQQLKNDLLQYPLYRHQGKRKHRSLADLMSDPTVKRLATDTATEYFDRFREVMNEACNLELIGSNPAGKMKIYKKKGRTGTEVAQEQETERVSFTNEDLIGLLKGYVFSGEYTGNKRNLTDAHFWGILVAMYSGMRINEICQLHISDIKTDAVRWHGRVFNYPFIKVGTDHSSQELKNSNAYRDVPIHQTLIDIGFLDWVKRRRSEVENPAEEKLFEGVRYDSHSKWGRELSRWFNGETVSPSEDEPDQEPVKRNGYKDLCIDESNIQGKVFHSFRHTFTDLIRFAMGLDKGSEPISASILGHEHDTSTAGYGDGHQIEVKAQAINLVKYSDEVESLVRSVSFERFEKLKWKIARRDSYLFVKKRRLQKVA